MKQSESGDKQRSGPAKRARALQMFQIIGVAAALLASVGTLLGVWFQLRAKKPNAEARILSADLITAPADLPGLSSTFHYKEAPVEALWKVKLTFANSG